ncbi:cob(I)yrinic acid a,c-diamide adenosyltransferase [Gemmatimonadota bacterium]
MSISTKKGDGGRTRLLSGEEVLKNSIRTSTYGDLDEAVSMMGLARALTAVDRIGEQLHEIQKVCFIIGAELAASPPTAASLKVRLDENHLASLETLGHELEEEVELPPVFIIPGGSPSSAAIDVARTIVRRVERGVVSLVQEEESALSNPSIMPYLNRLSDVLFLLARLEEKLQGIAFDRVR